MIDFNTFFLNLLVRPKSGLDRAVERVMKVRLIDPKGRCLIFKGILFFMGFEIV
jgi:hypothetical protein